MSRPGRVIYNPRERGISNDLTRLQDLVGADVMELLRGTAGVHTNPNAVAAEDRKVVFHGLAAVPGGGMTLSVGEGYGGIMRPGGPASADLSAYQLVRNRAAQTIPVGASDPVLNRYDLLEVAAADDLTESLARDIFDPVTNTFAPAVVPKIRKAGCVLTLTAGTPAANPVLPVFAAAAAGRMPIAAIRVGATLAAVTANDIVDLRPLWMPSPVTRMHGVVDGLVISVASMLAASTTIALRPGQAVVDGQLVRRTAAQTLTWANHVEAGLVLAINTWYYAYLIAGREDQATGFRPRHTVPGSPGLEGFVIFSATAPTSEGYPSAPLALPSSFANGHFYGGTVSRALYLGAFRSSTTASEVRPFIRTGDMIRQDVLDLGYTAPAGALPQTVSINLGAGNSLPPHCRLVEAYLRQPFVAGGNEEHTVNIQPQGGGVVYDAGLATLSPRTAETKVQNTPVFPIGLNSGQQVDLIFSAATNRLNTGASASNFRVVGIHDPIPRARV